MVLLLLPLEFQGIRGREWAPKVESERGTAASNVTLYPLEQFVQACRLRVAADSQALEEDDIRGSALLLCLSFSDR